MSTLEIKRNDSNSLVQILKSRDLQQALFIHVLQSLEDRTTTKSKAGSGTACPKPTAQVPEFPIVLKTSTLNSFSPRAVALWNALPDNVHQASSTYAFSFSNHILKYKPSTSLFCSSCLVFFSLFFSLLASFSSCYAPYSTTRTQSTRIGLLLLQSYLNIGL